MAPLNWQRQPVLVCQAPSSDIQATRKLMVRSGSTIRSSRQAFSYSGCFSTTGSKEVRTSSTVWINSGSPACLVLTSSITLARYAFI